VKILYGVHQFMPDFVGGTEQDTWEVATRMRDRGHDVSIVTRAPGAAGVETMSREGIPVTRLSEDAMTPISLFASTFGHRQLTRGFRRAFNEIRPDLVHFQHLRGLPAGVVGWIKAQGCPVLISLRDFWFVCPNAQLIDYVTEELCTTPGEPVRCARCAMVRVGLRPALFAAPALAPVMAARNRVLARVMQQADALLVYTQFVRAWFTEHGAPPEKVHLIPRGIPRPEIIPVRQRPQDDGRVRFVYIGGLAWQKGVHVVVEAFNSLPTGSAESADSTESADPGGPVELIIAGDETKFPDYVAELKALATHPGIRFVGRLDRPGVFQVMADADAVLVPSLWYETFSMLTREAFAMGVPVLVSDHGVLADAVTHEENGVRVAPGSVDAWRAAMARYIASPELRVKMKAGVKPPLTMAEYIDNLEAEYAAVMNR